MRDTAPFLPLFVPATRAERIAKAIASGAGAVIVDLEDAVAPGDKSAARAALATALPRNPSVPIYLRINPSGTPWHDDDLVAASGLTLAGIVLPKAEDPGMVGALRDRLGGRALLGLIETARGLAAARDLAHMFERMLFGSLDYAADLGLAHEDATLAYARAEVVLAARLAERPAPCDGVTTDPHDSALIEAETRRAIAQGFRGKLLIHPAQIAPARAAFRPAPARVEWAKRVIAAASEGVAIVDRAMVDAPVVALARRILQDDETTQGPDDA